MRPAGGNVALTATSWAPSAERCPEGPTRLDREIRVGVSARRADGSGRRTAGRWVAQPAVAAVRFKRPSGRRTRLSRARLGKAARVPRGADDPQGPNRPGAGGFARRQPDGVLGGRPSQVRAILTGRPYQDLPSPRRCMRSVLRRPSRRCRPGRRLVVQRRPKGSPHVPSPPP
jgi:hypothetical protein